MVEGLLAAWILSLFGFDNLFIKGFNEIFPQQITLSGYYVFFFLIGILGDFLEKAVKAGR